jgi:hypothetical protein
VSNATAGRVSPNARRKVGRAIEYLLFLSQNKKLPDTYHGRNYNFKIAFITLTLPSSQLHTDQLIKSECLNQFLIEAKKKWHVNRYVWRAEKQVNGNIHFHLLVDKFIPWSELRDVWNRITNKLGYVDRYRDQLKQYHSGGFKVRSDLLSKWDYKSQVKAYKIGKANDWHNPNSTDIHSLRHISNVKNYVIKYVSKAELSTKQSLRYDYLSNLILKKIPLSDEMLSEYDELYYHVSAGRLWGCSVSLSGITGARSIADNTIKSEVLDLLDRFHPDVFEGDHFTVINFDAHKLQSVGTGALFKLFSQYLINNFDYHLQLPMRF